MVRKSSTRSLLLFIVVTCSIGACQSRRFNAAKVASSGASTALALSALQDPPGSQLSANPPMDYAVDALIEELSIDPFPNGEVYDTLIQPSGVVAGWTKTKRAVKEPGGPEGPVMKGAWSVKDYEKLIPAARSPQRLAMGSVLEVMRRNRREYSKVIEGGAAQPNPPLQQSTYKFKSTLSEGQTTLRDPARPFSSTPCAGFDPVSYSDIKWHYYCAIPAIFRACHRLLIGKAFDAEAASFPSRLASGALTKDAFPYALNAAARKDYDQVIEYCTTGKLADAALQKKYTFILERMGVHADMVPAFKAMYENQKASAGGVNVFDYLMRSQVYAFRYEDQQTTLNAYYGDLKPDGKPLVPADCPALREPRLHIDSDTHCNPDAPKNFALSSNGR